MEASYMHNCSTKTTLKVPSTSGDGKKPLEMPKSVKRMLLFEGVWCKILYSAIFLLLVFCTNTSAEMIAEQFIACLKVNVFLPRFPSGRMSVTP